MKSNESRASTVPVQMKLLLTLWVLGNQESFRQIGDRFAVDRGTAHAYYVQVTDIMTSFMLCCLQLTLQ